MKSLVRVRTGGFFEVMEPSPLKRHFGTIFVISLAENSGRRGRLAAHLEDLGLARADELTWVRAVPGDRCWAPPYFLAGGGAWGCLQSHLRIAQDAAADGLPNYLVLEDDVVFHERSAAHLERFMTEVPDDWGQIYLGGQHLHEPDIVAGSGFVHRCLNVNRTHAYALRQPAIARFQQHVAHAPDYISRGSWHLDHQLGVAHELGLWRTYAPAWWLAGQEAGPSDISGFENPRLWWHLGRFSRGLPFIHFGEGDGVEGHGGRVHFGAHPRAGGLDDVELLQAIGNDRDLGAWMGKIAAEAMDRWMLPGIRHPDIPLERLKRCWTAGGQSWWNADLTELASYPYNGLFPHPLNETEPTLFCVKA